MSNAATDELHRRFRAICDAAEAEDRPLTEAEVCELDELQCLMQWHASPPANAAQYDGAEA